MPADHERFIRLAIDEADKGGAEGNSAVGTVIVQDNAVIGAGRNLVAASTLGRPPGRPPLSPPSG